MASGKFDGWAQQTRRLNSKPAEPAPTPATSTAGPQIIVPARQPPDLVPVQGPLAPHVPPKPAPAARLIAVHRPQVLVHPDQRAPAAKPAQVRTCLLVRPHEGVDRYAQLLGQLPELAPDLSGGVDAMKLGGLPNGAAIERWTENSRHYNGLTDKQIAQQQNGATVDQHLATRYSESQGAIRSATASVTRGKNTPNWSD